MFLKRSLFLVLCACFVFAQACSRPQSKRLDLNLTHEISPLPPRVGEVTLTLKLTDAGKPVTGARIALEGSMSHAGMVPVFAEAREIEAGRYQSSMQLSMAGDWIVIAHVVLPDNRKFEHAFEIKGVGPRIPAD